MGKKKSSSCFAGRVLPMRNRKIYKFFPEYDSFVRNKTAEAESGGEHKVLSRAFSDVVVRLCLRELLFSPADAAPYANRLGAY